MIAPLLGILKNQSHGWRHTFLTVPINIRGEHRSVQVEVSSSSGWVRFGRDAENGTRNRTKHPWKSIGSGISVFVRGWVGFVRLPTSHVIGEGGREDNGDGV